MNNFFDSESKLYAEEFIPEGYIKAVITMFHGVTEYSGRYHEMAQILYANNIATIICDLPGHGKTAKEYGENSMSFGETGWEGAAERVYQFVKREKAKFGNVPFFALGFSLGSFLTRTMLIKHPELELNGAILVGTGNQSQIGITLGKMMVSSEVKKHGRDAFTETIDSMAFDGYNKAFAPNKTRMDWLCANEVALEEYMKDELVGQGFTAGLFYDLLYGMGICIKQKNINQMNKNIPVLLLSGKNDAVGENGKGIEKVARSFNKAGVKTTIHLYEGMRHDVFHEIGSEKVVSDLIEWIKAVNSSADK